MPLPAAPLRRRRRAAQRTPAAALVVAGLVLGVVGGWVAGLMRVRTP